MRPYDIVTAFEVKMAEYVGVDHCVAVNSCTNALLLSMVYRFMTQHFQRVVILPRYTYVGVAQAVLAAGAVCEFLEMRWSGWYELQTLDDAGRVPMGIHDSARALSKHICAGDQWNYLRCFSFHWYKHLPVGAGGMIATDDEEAAATLRRMRYDGRTAGVHPTQDTFDVPGYHCLMTPETAARGLMLLDNLPDDNEFLPWDNYDDLSRHPMFTRGLR